MLTLQTYQTFMTRWLVPRLPDYYSKHPNIELRIATSSHGMDFETFAADCSIRYGEGKWDDADSALIFQEAWCCVCSKSFLERHSSGGLSTIFAPTNLLHHHKHPSIWREWLEAAGLPFEPARYDMVFNHHAIVTELARAGVGVALEQSAYVADDLREGRLFQPHPLILSGSRGYYLTYPRDSGPSEKIQAFQAWMQSQAVEMTLDLVPAP